MIHVEQYRQNTMLQNKQLMHECHLKQTHALDIIPLHLGFSPVHYSEDTVLCINTCHDMSEILHIFIHLYYQLINENVD